MPPVAVSLSAKVTDAEKALNDYDVCYRPPFFASGIGAGETVIVGECPVLILRVDSALLQGLIAFFPVLGSCRVPFSWL